MQRLNTWAQVAGILFGLVSLVGLTLTIPTVSGRVLLWAPLVVLIFCVVNLTRSLCARAEDRRRQLDREALQADLDDMIAQARAIAEARRAASNPNKTTH